MARVARRCIKEALDRSHAAQIIILTTDAGEHPSIALPPASLKFIEATYAIRPRSMRASCFRLSLPIPS